MIIHSTRCAAGNSAHGSHRPMRRLGGVGRDHSGDVCATRSPADVQSSAFLGAFRRLFGRGRCLCSGVPATKTHHRDSGRAGRRDSGTSAAVCRRTACTPERLRAQRAGRVRGSRCDCAARTQEASPPSQQQNTPGVIVDWFLSDFPERCLRSRCFLSNGRGKRDDA